MSVALRVRFPQGTYHATSWDRTANAGDVEWPPSPWRLMRALLAVWHAKVPEESADDIRTLITALCSVRPEYMLPRSSRSQTRHYLPQFDRTAHGGRITLTVDGRLHVAPDDPMWIRWPGLQLGAAESDLFKRLVGELTYLGRAESVCEAEIGEPEVTGPWVTPIDPASRVDDETDTVRVLVPGADLTVEQLEVTSDQMRKSGRSTPDGAQWVIYQRAVPRVATHQEMTWPQAHGVRWSLGTSPPFEQRHGVLAASALRWKVMKVLEGKEPRGFRDRAEHVLIAGPHGSEAVDLHHRHAHWLFLPHLSSRDERQVESLVLWVPDEEGIPDDWVSKIARSWRLPRFEYAPKGYVSGELYFESAGSAAQVLPERYMGHARVWRSVTPVATSRYQKPSHTQERFWTKTIQRELEMRMPADAPEVIGVEVREDSAHGDLRGWRRYRWRENLGQARRAAMLTVHLDRELCGPLVLGDLAHFGLGLFAQGDAHGRTSPS